MKRILIFIGLKIVELSLAVLLFFAGYYFMEWLANFVYCFKGIINLESYILQSFTGVLMILLFFCIVLLIIIISLLIPDFIRSNWDRAGNIEDKLRRK